MVDEEATCEGSHSAGKAKEDRAATRGSSNVGPYYWQLQYQSVLKPTVQTVYVEPAILPVT